MEKPECGSYCDRDSEKTCSSEFACVLDDSRHIMSGQNTDRRHAEHKEQEGDDEGDLDLIEDTPGQILLREFIRLCGLLLLVRDKIQSVIQHHKRLRECFQKVLGHSQRGFYLLFLLLSQPAVQSKLLGFIKKNSGWFA